jgi:hypothetical protein
MLFAPRGRVAQWQSSGLLSHWLKVRVLPRSFYILSHWLKVRRFAEPSLPRSLNRRFEAEKPYKTAFSPTKTCQKAGFCV